MTPTARVSRSHDLGYLGLHEALGRVGGGDRMAVLLPPDLVMRRVLSLGRSEALYVMVQAPNRGDAYDLQITNLVHCDSTPCTIGTIEGRRTAFPSDDPTTPIAVSLSGGRRGSYAPPSSMNISDGTLTWSMPGGYYRLSIKEGHERDMVTLVNSAIAHGPWH